MDSKGQTCINLIFIFLYRIWGYDLNHAATTSYCRMAIHQYALYVLPCYDVIDRAPTARKVGRTYIMSLWAFGPGRITSGPIIEV